MGTFRTLVVLSKGFSVIAIIFQLIAFCIPGWMILYIVGTKTNFALWYVHSCTDVRSSFRVGGEQCPVFSYHELRERATETFDSSTQELQNLGYMVWVEFEIEATLALFFCGVGVLLMFRAVSRVDRDRRLEDFNRTKMQILGAFILMLLSGILILVPVGKLGQAASQMRKGADIYESIVDEESPFDVGVPYALIIAGFGGSLTLICAILLIFLYGMHRSPPETMGEISSPMVTMAPYQQGYTITPTPQAKAGPPPEYREEGGEPIHLQGRYLYTPAGYTSPGPGYVQQQPYYTQPQGYSFPPPQEYDPAMQGYDPHAQRQLQYQQAPPVPPKGVL